MAKDIKDKITWERLSEIATQALHGLIEDDYDSAMEYFRDTIDLTDEEREYFGVPTETEEEEENPYYDAYAEGEYKRMSEVGALFYDEEQWDYADRNYNRLYDDEEDDYTPSATNGDYSPSNPWDAPGMSIRDFI